MALNNLQGFARAINQGRPHLRDSIAEQVETDINLVRLLVLAIGLVRASEYISAS